MSYFSAVVKIHDLKSSSNLNGVELNIASHDEAGSKPKVILQNEIIANGKFYLCQSLTQFGNHLFRPRLHDVASMLL